MRRAAPLALALLLVLGIVPAASASPGEAAGGSSSHLAKARPDEPLSASGRWIVLLRNGASVSAAAQHARGRGIGVDGTYPALKGYAARMTGSQAAELRTDPSVAEVVPDALVSIAGQSVPVGVRRVGGKDNAIAAIDGADDRVDADVAIVDTGIGDSSLTPPSHEDLNIAGGYNCYDSTPSNGLPPNRSKWGDPNGHGTHVAGTVGALDNGFGVVGVAPGVRLWAVRILNAAGDGLLSWYLCGLDWITAQRDPVDPSRPLFEAVNMSVAKSGSDDRNCGLTNGDVLHQAICRLVASGVTVAAAAGNNSFNASRLVPASYNEVITVSALADTDGRPGGLGGNLCYSWNSWDQDDTFADFSNYGHDVDLIAPGKCTNSTLPGDRYGWMSGTSMATPLVTGAIALYKSARPWATPAQVKAALQAAGTQDWATATDPDSYHEPLLDVSHIVAPDDFTVDATPGTSRDALVAAGGATLDLPVQLFRGEEFPDEVTLAATADEPLAVDLATGSLAGLDATTTSMQVTVPGATPSGDYKIKVIATDAADTARARTSTYVVHVDSDVPVAVAPAALAVTSTRFGTSSIGVRVGWAAGSDAAGGISSYDARWIVDGVTGNAFSVSAVSRSAARTIYKGHTYALEVRARDAAGNRSPWVRGEDLRPVIVQDTSRTLARTGSWHRSTRSSWSGGSTLYSRVKNSSLTRTFTGRGIAIVSPKGPTRGRMAIWIDGAYVRSVGLHAKSLHSRRVVYSTTWPTAGAHSIRIAVVGTAGHPRIDLDAFVIIR